MITVLAVGVLYPTLGYALGIVGLWIWAFLVFAAFTVAVSMLVPVKSRPTGGGMLTGMLLVGLVAVAVYPLTI